MSLEFSSIRHAYGAAAVVREASFIAPAGAVTCLLGASGSGKTTLLRLAAGLLRVQAGAVRLDGAVLADPGVHPPPERRPVGLVFQDGALFPHLSVTENVGFAIPRRAADRPARIATLLARVGLTGFGDRFPETLSGGQQQRVALARALASKPRVLLLDEPFASVDVTLRRRLREDLRLVLKEAGAVTMIVTHDPDEALEMADRIVVMDEGRVVQDGAPEELFAAPATMAVATLVAGARAVSGVMNGDWLSTPFGRWPASALRRRVASGQVDLAVRAGALELEPVGPCRVVDVRRHGEATRVTVIGEGGARLVAEPRQADGVAVGDTVAVSPREGSLSAFPAVDVRPHGAVGVQR